MINSKGKIMFNIYQYINSKTVADYLKKKKYKFSTLEALWIVYFSFKLNLIEKNKVYIKIMEEYPNCEYKKGDLIIKDVFAEVKKYIKKIEKGIDEFKKNKKDEVFTYEYYYGEDIDFSSDIFYTSYDKLYKKLENSRKAEPKHKFGKYIKPNEYVIKKSIIDGYVWDGSMTLNDNLEVTDISFKDDRMDFFMEMYLKFPVPFKKGDIIYFAGDIHKEPLVYDVVGYANNTVNENYLDCFDMLAMCYSISDNGRIKYDHYNNYMNIEKYDGKLRDKYKRLKTISSYLKGKIPLDLLLNVNTELFVKERVDEFKNDITYIEQIKKHSGV